MKRTITLVLTLCLALALTGCGGQEDVNIDLDAFYNQFAQENELPMMMGWTAP